MAPGTNASGVDLAAIINAVKDAYMSEVVNSDLKRRVTRHDHLKKIKDSYAEMLQKKREALRKLSDSPGRFGPLTELKKKVVPHLYRERIQLRLERTEAETLLERRKQEEKERPDPTGKESARKEIARLDERIAVLNARQRVLDEELEHLNREIRTADGLAADAKQFEEDIAQMEEVARKVAREVEVLNLELEAPPRIRPVDDAVAPRS
jgi:hypothetical protein